MTEETRRGPRLIEEGLPPAPASPDEAPEIDGAPPAPRALPPRRGAGLGGLFLAAFGGLVSFAAGLWAWELVEGLTARNLWLGRAALALALLAGFALFAAALRELAGLSRLRRLDGLRERAAQARSAGARAAAAETVAALLRLYRARPELEAARAGLERAAAETLDADGLLDAAERALLAPLDRAAEAEVRRGARDAAAATALLPLPALDMILTLAVNLRTIRRIAEIYGGRAGWLGSVRLLRAVAGHLVAAGAIAVGEDLVGPALGHGVVSKLSRRLGEGVANGALAARIGVAAIEVCRPLPFAARPRPGAASLLGGALRSLGGNGPVTGPGGGEAIR